MNKNYEEFYQQAKNAIRGFQVVNVIKDAPVLLIDDMVDSKWTLTVCGEMFEKKFW